MINKGYQLTCNGCGTTAFVESSVTPRKLNFKNGTHSTYLKKDESESWVLAHQCLDLCPRCAKIYEEMLCRFYEKCTEARENE